MNDELPGILFHVTSHQCRYSAVNGKLVVSITLDGHADSDEIFKQVLERLDTGYHITVTENFKEQVVRALTEENAALKNLVKQVQSERDQYKGLAERRESLLENFFRKLKGI
jgi:uncharacterized protein YbbC (DUF1343 family)